MQWIISLADGDSAFLDLEHDGRFNFCGVELAAIDALDARLIGGHATERSLAEIYKEANIALFFIGHLLGDEIEPWLAFLFSGG